MPVKLPFRTRGQSFPPDLWTKCPSCGEMLYNKQLEKNLRVCTKCGHHFRLRAEARLALLLDEAVAIEQVREPRVDSQPEVVATIGTHTQVLLELLVVEHLVAPGAPRPEVGREVAASRAERKLDRHQAAVSGRDLRRHATQAAAPASDTPEAIAPPTSRR